MPKIPQFALLYVILISGLVYPPLSAYTSVYLTLGMGGELLSNLVFEFSGSCGDLIGFGGFDSVFESDAGDDLSQIIKAAQFPPVLLGRLAKLENHVQHAIA